MSLVLALAVLATEPFPIIEHNARVEHSGGAADVQYRSRVTLKHRQTGIDHKPASSLRCQWRANIVVERVTQVGGNSLSRSIDRTNVIQGSAPGHCAAQRRNIAREVAKRTDEIRTHVAAVAAEDAPVLKAEIERGR